MFNIDFIYVIANLLPDALRSVKMMSWMQVVTSGLNSVYNMFLEFKKTKLYEINFTGQVMYLEKKLKTGFTETLYISDGVRLETSYLSNRSEGDLPVFLFNANEQGIPLMLYNMSEVEENADFNVNIPATYFDTMTIAHFKKMERIINYYLVFGKKYKIRRI